MKAIEKGGLKTVETCRNSELLKRGVITMKNAGTVSKL